MASLSNIRGKWIIQFKLDRRRPTIHLGGLQERTARGIKAHIEQIILAKAHGLAIPLDTAAWVNSISAELHEKLARADLVISKESALPRTIRGYFDYYINKRKGDLKPSTIHCFNQTRNSAVAAFGANTQMAKLTRGDAGDWFREETKTKAEATVTMLVKKMRQVFNDAVDRKLLSENPFKGIKLGSMSNPDRQEYIDRGRVLRVIEHCNDPEWRLLFGLARFGGLRIPSESRALMWDHIIWDRHRMVVPSPKTARNKRKATRIVPIFPEVMPLLLAAFEKAEGKHVFARLRGDNLATSGHRHILAAGEKVWGKTWQNLRSSFETDLADTFPIHVACAWAGNSVGVAMRHYFMVKEEDFDRAANRAAVNAGQDRTQTSDGDKKARIYRDNAQSERSLQESNL